MKLKSIRNSIVVIVLKPILAYCKHTITHKINIIDFQKNNNQEGQSPFEKSFENSLDLIQLLDQSSYNTIQTEIKWIIQSKRLSQNRYIDSHKLYVIKYMQYWDDQQLVDIYNAGTLIDFISYQCLASRYKSVTNTQQKKIENICLLKERQFYKEVEKLYPIYEGQLINQFIA